MSKLKRIIFLIMAFMCLFQFIPSANAVTQGDDFETFMTRIRKEFRKKPNIDDALKLFNDNTGAFSDIDYKRNDMTNWPPLKHLDRLGSFVAAYTNESSNHYGDEILYERIVKGLQYWQDADPNCKNWWFNQIAEPQALGVILIQMRSGKKHVPQTLEEAILERMRKDGGDPAKWTGANCTDICLHWIYRSCLQRNEADLQKAMQLVFDPIRYTTKEGFQNDKSFFQHGTQLYIGGYGDEILKGVTQVAMYALGTKYALSDEKVQIVSKFMRETYYPTIRGKYMLYDVMGRSMSRRNILDKSSKKLFARRMIQLDPKHADEFKQIVARLSGKEEPSYGISPRHTHYFRGDYTLHVRPGYIFDVRMVSDRTSRVEYGNAENLKTYFVSDGCNNIVKKGDEYYNIFPVWNWTRIPGTTAPQMNPVPLAQKDWQQPGTSKFAGGVSDSIYGASAYAYDDLWAGINTHARKSWFFFDDEIVCLGAGITSDNASPIMTTLNQRLANAGTSFAVVGNDGKAKNEPKFITSSSVKAVQYDGVGYVFPNGGNVVAELKKQEGSWYEINHAQPKGNVIKKVFTVALDHGVKPSDATYSYIVVPESGEASTLANYADGRVAILSNTSELQAVQQKKLGIWQMVFYSAGTYKDKNITVEADKPCAVMVRLMADGSVKLHVADPAQKQQQINVGVKLKGSIKKQVNTLCDFTNTGVYAGATKAFKLK